MQAGTQEFSKKFRRKMPETDVKGKTITGRHEKGNSIQNRHQQGNQRQFPDPATALNNIKTESEIEQDPSDFNAVSQAEPVPGEKHIVGHLGKEIQKENRINQPKTAGSQRQHFTADPEKIQVKLKEQEDWKSSGGKQEEREKKGIHQTVHFGLPVLFFYQFQCKSLSESEGTQIKVIGNPKEKKPDAVLFISQLPYQHGGEQKHGAHIGSEQGIAASQMQDKALVTQQLLLNF